MQARITFRVETYVDGKDIAEIQSKFENMVLPDNIQFVELVSVEDSDTYNDLMDEWN